MNPLGSTKKCFFSSTKCLMKILNLTLNLKSKFNNVYIPQNPVIEQKIHSTRIYFVVVILTAASLPPVFGFIHRRMCSEVTV